MKTFRRGTYFFPFDGELVFQHAGGTFDRDARGTRGGRTPVPTSSLERTPKARGLFGENRVQIFNTAILGAMDDPRPIIELEDLKILDRKIVLNSVILKWDVVKKEFKERIKF
mgnify:CR=1 FL=1